MLFGWKDQGSRGRTALLQGGRVEHSLRTAVFRFLGEDHFPLHVVRNLLAKEFHDRRGDIDQAGGFGVDRAVAEEDSRHDVGINTVVARPAAGVIGDGFLGYLPHRALPAVAIAAFPSHQKKKFL